MSIDHIILAGIALALIGAGVYVRAQAEKRDRYLLLAQEAGFKPEELEGLYQSFRANKLIIANLLLWLGIGVLIVGAFNLWYAARAA